MESMLSDMDSNETVEMVMMVVKATKAVVVGEIVMEMVVVVVLVMSAPEASVHVLVVVQVWQ